MTAAPHARRDRLRYDRTDRLATVVVLWFVVGANAAYALFIAVDWALRRQVTLTDVPVDVAPHAVGAGEVVGGPAKVQVLVQDVGAWHFTLLLAASLVSVVAIAWGAVLLSRFIRDLSAGAPFAHANITRLRVVAMLLLLVPPIAEVIQAAAGAVVLDADGGAGVVVDLNPAWIVAGLLVAAVAQAFAAGARLQDDVDGLV